MASKPVRALAFAVIVVVAGPGCASGSAHHPAEADRSFYEAAVAIARAGDAHARAPERFPGVEDYDVGLEEQRRTDPSLTLSTHDGYRLESDGHAVAYCLVFGEDDRTHVTDCDGHDVEAGA